MKRKNVLSEYLIVHKSILPDYFDSVIHARHLLESGKAESVSDAVRMVGISRSTFYKYKDFILETGGLLEGRKAVFSMILSHEPGILSHVLQTVSQADASVLTITQNLPIHHKASVTITLDVSAMGGTLETLLNSIAQLPGVENARVIAID